MGSRPLALSTEAAAGPVRNLISALAASGSLARRRPHYRVHRHGGLQGGYEEYENVTVQMELIFERPCSPYDLVARMEPTGRREAPPDDRLREIRDCCARKDRPALRFASCGLRRLQALRLDQGIGLLGG